MEEDTKNHRHGWKQDDPTTLLMSGVGGATGGEADTLRRLYHEEIDQVLGKLEAQLQQVAKAGPASSLVGYAEDNLRVLRACYVREELSSQALDVLLQHLLELTQVLRR
jgi:hypothetical protein